MAHHKHENPKGEESCCTGTYECRGAQGEAERDNGPVDRCPAERARHGRCAPGFRAKQDSVVEESAGATSLSAIIPRSGKMAHHNHENPKGSTSAAGSAAERRSAATAARRAKRRKPGVIPPSPPFSCAARSLRHSRPRRFLARMCRPRQGHHDRTGNPQDAGAD